MNMQRIKRLTFFLHIAGSEVASARADRPDQKLHQAVLHDHHQPGTQQVLGLNRAVEDIAHEDSVPQLTRVCCITFNVS